MPGKAWHVPIGTLSTRKDYVYNYYTKTRSTCDNFGTGKTNKALNMCSASSGVMSRHVSNVMDEDIKL